MVIYLLSNEIKTATLVVDMGNSFDWLEHIKHTSKYTHRHRFMCKKIYKFSFKQFWAKRNCYKEIVQPLIKIDTDKKKRQRRSWTMFVKVAMSSLWIFLNLFPPQKNLGQNLRFLRGDISFAGSWARVRPVITGRRPEVWLGFYPRWF